MAFPAFPYSPLPIGVELTLSSGQHDITDDVDRAGLSITRGRSDESSQVGPGAFKFKVRNPTGTYSPRNPSGALYGEIGRNTPCLAYAELGSPRAVMPTGADYWSCPDAAALDVTGDIDLRVDIRPTTWRPSATAWIGILKSGAYGLWITTEGKMVMHWTDSTPTTHNVTSTVAIPAGSTGRKSIRATLDVNNGAAGHTVTFYLWSGGAWVQFGDPVITAGTTNIRAHTTALTALVTTELGVTSIYEVQVRNGIGGSLVANPIFTNQTSGTTSFSDGLGNTWTPTGQAKCWNRHYRVNAEVAEWPARWSEKGAPESFVEVDGAGVLRRLSQGQSPLRSALYRGCSTLSDLVSYWPCEDGDTATTVAGFDTTRAGQVYGDVDMAAYDGVPASEGLPELGNGRLTLKPNPSAITGELQVRFILNMPVAPANGTVLAKIYTTSSLAFFEIVYGTGDTLTVTANKDEATVLGTIGPVAWGSDLRQPLRMSLEATQNGANVDFAIATLLVGKTTGGVSGATTGVCTLGAPSTIYFNHALAALGDTAVGHVTAQSNITSLFDLSSQLNAYSGEAATTRISRLATENGIALEMIGAAGISSTCGPQLPAQLLDLLREAATIDGGILYEPDTGNTLAYRSLDSIGRQTPVTLAYVENQYRPLEPTEDDQGTRNDVTVTRSGAGSARAVDEDGPLGVTAVGRYDEDVTLNLHNDLDAVHQAQWRVNLGTVDDLRWPQVGFNLADPRILADPDLILTLAELDIGDRITITDLPEWLPPFPCDVIVQGISETITGASWAVVLNTSPAAPYDLAEADWATRWGNDTTTLASDVTTTATSWSVATTDLPLWTHADGDYDLIIGGEVVTVTNVTGASSPQTFTVVRSVNGVVKAHTAGDTIELYQPRRWSL